MEVNYQKREFSITLKDRTFQLPKNIKGLFIEFMFPDSVICVNNNCFSYENFERTPPKKIKCQNNLILSISSFQDSLLIINNYQLINDCLYYPIRNSKGNDSVAFITKEGDEVLLYPSIHYSYKKTKVINTRSQNNVFTKDYTAVTFLEEMLCCFSLINSESYQQIFLLDAYKRTEKGLEVSFSDTLNEKSIEKIIMNTNTGVTHYEKINDSYFSFKKNGKWELYRNDYYNLHFTKIADYLDTIISLNGYGFPFFLKKGKQLTVYYEDLLSPFSFNVNYILIKKYISTREIYNDIKHFVISFSPNCTVIIEDTTPLFTIIRDKRFDLKMLNVPENRTLNINPIKTTLLK